MTFNTNFDALSKWHEPDISYQHYWNWKCDFALNWRQQITTTTDRQELRDYEARCSCTQSKKYVLLKCVQKNKWLTFNGWQRFKWLFKAFLHWTTIWSWPVLVEYPGWHIIRKSFGFSLMTLAFKTDIWHFLLLEAQYIY